MSFFCFSSFAFFEFKSFALHNFDQRACQSGFNIEPRGVPNTTKGFQDSHRKRTKVAQQTIPNGIDAATNLHMGVSRKALDLLGGSLWNNCLACPQESLAYRVIQDTAKLP